MQRTAIRDANRRDPSDRQRLKGKITTTHKKTIISCRLKPTSGSKLYRQCEDLQREKKAHKITFSATCNSSAAPSTYPTLVPNRFNEMTILVNNSSLGPCVNLASSANDEAPTVSAARKIMPTENRVMKANKRINPTPIMKPDY